ncbi:hypothetical protein L7F22_021187 [Adiantum nelumboides]|nr:hypothetical protein [Adiantum nelumboides]
MDATVQRILDERRATGKRHRPARAHARRRRQAGEHAAVPQRRRAVRHLPRRRPRDDERAALLRHRVPAQGPRRRRPRAGGGRPGPGHRPRGAADGGAARAARLRPPDPRRVAAALADRAGVHPRTVRERSTVGGWGPFEPGQAIRRDAPCPPNAFQAVRSGSAGLHRAPVRDAGGDARPRHGPAALRPRRPRRLPARDPGVAHAQAEGAHDPRASPHRPDRRRPPPRGPDPRAPVGVAPGARGRPSRHAAAGAVRLEPGGVGGPRHPDRPRRDRARLDRPHGRARRGGGGAAHRGRGRRRQLLVQRAAAGQRRPVLRVGGRGRDGAAGVRYTVFGCGNRDWAATYQAVPTRIDAALEARGATRVYPRGEGDARGDLDGAFEAWCAGLWDALAGALGVDTAAAAPSGRGPRLTLTLEQRRTASPVLQSYRGQPRRCGSTASCAVGAGPVGAAPGDRAACGDLLPGGRPPRGPAPQRRVGRRRAIARFGLDAGQYVTLTASGGAPTHLPVGEPYPLLGILAGCVELQDVASRAGLAAMAAALPEGAERSRLAGLAGTDAASRAAYREQVAGPRRSLLDLLEAHPDCALPFAEFLDLLPALRPRFYSISSSPAVTSDVALTVGVLTGPARAGDGSTFHGVCSTHLAGVPEGGRCSRSCASPRSVPAAREPARPDDHDRGGDRVGALPRVLPGARGAAGARGADRAVALLFLGCRDPQQDLLYADELAGFAESGVTTLHPAYSRVAGPPPPLRPARRRGRGRRRVGRAAGRRGRLRVRQRLDDGPGARAALIGVFRARTGAGAADGEAWLAGLRAGDRYLEDIWARRPSCDPPCAGPAPAGPATAPGLRRRGRWPGARRACRPRSAHRRRTGRPRG